MRSVLPALLLAALLVTAGCSEWFDDGPATDPGGVETGAETAGTPSDAGLDHPPGLSSAGLDDPDALVNAHADVLRGQSVTLREHSVRREANGSLASRTNLTVRTAANRTRFLADSDATGRRVYGSGDARVVTFSDGTGIYRRVETPNGSWADELRSADGDASAPEFLGLDLARTDDLYVVLSAFALEDPSSVRRAIGDPRRFRVESSEVAGTGLLASYLDLTAVREATLTAVVTADGLVAEYQLEYVGTEEGRVVEGTVTLRYAKIGATTVETPAWKEAVTGSSAGNLTATVGTTQSAS